MNLNSFARWSCLAFGLGFVVLVPVQDHTSDLTSEYALKLRVASIFSEVSTDGRTRPAQSFAAWR